MTGRHFSDARLRQAFSVAPLLVGGDPHATTSIYAMIHHLERADGVWFPRGGFGAVVSALGRLMEEAGVDIRLGETVERVLVEHGRAVGVLLHGGRRVSADLVVSNADPMQLYGEMLPKAAQSRLARARTRHARPSMGVVLLHFGAERRWPGVAQHTIRFGGRYREALRDVFRRGRMPEDPPIYLHRPTATDPSLAPEGCDAFYALVPAPTLRAGVDWREEGPRMRDRIVATLDATILPGLAGAIRAERLTTPADFAERYLSVDGAGFSLAPDFTQSAWFRFHNRGEGVSSLYLVGAGAHPGAGVPGVLSSAKAVDSLVPAPESAS
jgi:phytoene desaturase